MTVVRAVARPMLASIFAIQGYNTMNNPERVVARAERVVRPLAEHVPIVPGQTEESVAGDQVVDCLAGGHAQQLHRLSHVEQGAQMVLPGGRALHEERGPATDVRRLARRGARQGATLDQGGTEGVDGRIDGAGHGFNIPSRLKFVKNCQGCTSPP